MEYIGLKLIGTGVLLVVIVFGMAWLEVEDIFEFNAKFAGGMFSVGVALIIGGIITAIWL